MKKIKFITFLTVAFLLIFCTTAYASENVFDAPDVIGANDYAKVMQPSTVEYINASNDALMSRYKSKIVFVTVPTTGKETIDSYAEQLYKSWSLAYTGDGSSVMVVLATEDMEYWPIVGSHIQSALSPDIVNNILLQYMEPDFEKRDFDGAIRKTYDAFNNWYSSTYNDAYKTDNENNNDKGSSKEKSKFPGLIWTMFKILFFGLIVIFILYIYMRRKIRLKRLAKRKRMRRATIEKYRSEPKEQYSFSYSYIRDDDEWDS